MHYFFTLSHLEFKLKKNDFRICLKKNVIKMDFALLFLSLLSLIPAAICKYIIVVDFEG